MGKYLRLTGGSFAGRRLYVPKTGVRPATNMVREAIFMVLDNILPGGVEEKRVLDLFAGSGSLGFEALSRGASSVTFVERAKDVVGVLKKNVSLMGFKNVEIYRGDAISYLKTHLNEVFDIVFVNPPYGYEKISEVFQLISGLRDVSNSIVVYEKFYKDREPDLRGIGHILKKKTYGQTEILYVRLLETPEAVEGPGK